MVCSDTHVETHLYMFPCPGQGSGHLANILWSRCVRVVDVQLIDHPSLHNNRLLLFARTAGMSFFNELCAIEASKESPINLHFILLAENTSYALNPPMIL